MKRLLLMAAAVAAGLVAKRAWENRNAPDPALLDDAVVPDAGDTLDVAAVEENERGWPAVVPSGNDGVLGALVMFDEHIVASAEIALNRDVDDGALTLAAMLRDEHRMHLDHSRALIDRFELELAQDPAVAEIEAWCYARRSELAAADDEVFEATWVFDTIDDHEAMIGFIDEVLLDAAADDRVREHVRMTREHLATHLAQARMLA